MEDRKSPRVSASDTSSDHTQKKTDYESGDGVDEDPGPEPVLSSESEASSSTSDSDGELASAIVFPAQQHHKLNDGLNRSSWVVHINCLVECERVAAALIRSPDRGGLRDLEIVTKFIREPLTEAFEKVLLDSAITMWGHHLQLQIFDAVLGLIEVTAAKLAKLDPPHAIDAAQAFEDEIDLIALLEPLVHAFDSDSTFNLKNAECVLPKVPRDLPTKYAIPRAPEQPGSGMANSPRADVEDCAHFTTYSWTAYFVNYFGHRKGFQFIQLALDKPKRISLELLKHLLSTVLACRPVATEHLIGIFETDFVCLLTFIEDAIEENVERLSECGSDKMFQNLSSVFRILFGLLSRSRTISQAEEMVSGVQCKFVLQMLSYSNFSKHLSAVRETNALVRRALDLAVADHGAAMERVKQWLQQHNIVGQLLRANLHQKQYVEQVQKVLRNLVLEGCLEQEHIALLWDLTEKPDTFEAVRINVFSVLAELAQLFNEEQLDFLFNKFESSAAKCTSDNKQGMLLLFRLAKVDTQGVMTKRILGLLWRTSLASTVSSGLDMTLCFADVLRDYALTSRNSDTRDIALDYVSQLVQELSGTEKALPALRVLSHLIAHSNNHTAPILTVLKRSGDMLQIVLGSLQRFMGVSLHLRECQQHNLPPWQHFHYTAITHYSGFLLDLAECLYDEPLSWSFVKGLWETLVEGALVQHDKDIAFLWFCNVLSDGRSVSGAPDHSWAIIDKTSSQMLLTQKMAKLDPATLSKDGYRCFASYFNALAEEQQMESGSDTELSMPGIDFLWRVVLDMPSQDSQVITASQAVVRASQEMLIKLYQRRNTDAPVSPALCHHFIRSCVGNLLAAADGIQTGEVELTRQLSAQRAGRCMQLLQDMIRACKGRTMPTRAAHAASFCGSTITVGVTAPNMHQTKYQVDMNLNSYVGQLRQQVASKPAFSLPPARLRMFLGGKELLNDALLLHETGFTPEQSVVNVMGVALNNSYSSPNPELLASQEAASPALLLAREHPNIYGVLLELADHCNVADVRANAVQLLNCLPTHSQVLDSLRAALQGPQAAQDLESLLCQSQAVVAPTRLLYTLQALSALLQPQGKMLQVAPITPEGPPKDETAEAMSSGGSDELEPEGKPDKPTEHSADLPPAALQQIVLQSGVIRAVLQAVRQAGNRPSTDIATTRSLYDIAHDMAYRLVSKRAGHMTPPSIAATQPGTKQADSSVSAAPASPMSAQAATVVSCGDGGVTSTSNLPEHAATEPQAQPMMIALEVVFFYLHEAFEAARGWGREVKHAGQDEEADVLPEADVAMVARSISASLGILQEDHAALLLPFLQQSASRRLLVGVLLSENHETCRELGAQFLQRVSMLSPVAHQWVLLLLSDSMAEAESKPRFCSQYFQQFAKAIQALPQQSQAVQQMELQTAEQLLTDLVACLPHLSTVDELDMRMQGKLELLLQLLCVLGSRCLASADSQQLVYLLLTDYLFPEAHVRTEFTSLQDVPPAQLHAALVPRCSSAASRLAALKLLKELTSHSSVNLQTGLRLIQQLHLSAEGTASVDNMPIHAIRAPLNSFVGLKNGGATCYMNSVFQQLFMQPSIRKMLLAVPESSDDQTDNVFYQMQNMFANLALTNQDYYVPRCFWMAFKDYDGQRLNLREHQDAYEFFTRLQDIADQYLRDRRSTPVLQAVIGGKFAQQIICKGLPYRSEKEEEFYQLSLDVRGKQTLEESLDLYVQGELMEGDNQYFCEEASRKVDAIKRSCIKGLPHTLVIHLKRFEFDYETMTRWKIKDRFEFPQQLNMYKYTVEGLAEAEQTEAVQAATPDKKVDAQGQYEYELKGVVVHSGTAFAGHYYSYIKARPNDGCPASSDKWFCFDDVNVESWDIANLDTDCFGGKYTLSAQHFSGPQQEYDRPNSAYMLFYERSGVLEPVHQPAPSSSLVPEAQAETPSVQQQHQPEPCNLQSPGLPQTSPEQSLTSQQAADAPAAQVGEVQAGMGEVQAGLGEVQAGSPMQTQPSAACSPQAVEAHMEAQESPQGPQASPVTAQQEQLSSGLASPVLQQPKSSPSGTPDILPHLANLSPLKGVSTLDLGQDTVMQAADQEVVQPLQRPHFQPSSTVSLPSNMPTHIHEGVILGNLQLLRETHLMDRDYFKLIMALVKGSSEICNHKIRRTGMADEEAVSLDPSSRSSGPSRRAEDSDGMAILAAEVAIIFLFKIYLRVGLHAREDLAEWRSILQNIMESSATATRLVLVTLAHSDAHRRQPLLEETILTSSGEVREFASGVVHDALKIAVTLHQGEFDPSADTPEDSMPAAVNRMVDALLQAGLTLLRDDRSLDQAYFAQLLMLFRDYGCLGQLQRQHLASMPHMFEFAAQIVDNAHTYPGSANQQFAELQASVLLLAMLMRLLDMSPLLTTGSVAANNPYKYSNAATVSLRLLAPVVLDVILQMCRVEFFAEPAVRETLLYLSWENSELSVKVLDAVFAICKKADVHHLYHLAPHYAALVGLEDSLKQPRLQYFLVARRGAHESGPGVAGLLLPNRANRQAWRRLALFRLMYLACRDCPEVVAKIIKSFPDVISHDNISATYHALAQDNVSPAIMLEIRGFLQNLLDLVAAHSEG